MADRSEQLVNAAAIGWAGLAAVGIAAPGVITGVFGQPITSPSYRSEVRAVYAGMSVGFAATLAWANLDRPRRRQAIQTVGVTTAAIAASRVFTAWTDKRLDAWPTGVFLATEVAMAAALLTAR